MAWEFESPLAHMTESIEKQLSDWEFVIQSLTFDLLQSLNEDQLSLTVGKNMGTMGEQFRHIIRVRFQYAEAIISGKISEVKEEINPDICNSKDELIKLWEKSKEDLKNNAKKIDNPNEFFIDYSFWHQEPLSIQDHLNALMDHETLHNGELVVYLKTLEIPFPESWKTWGL